MAHRLHFAKAADDLSVAQPALSQSVRALAAVDQALADARS